MTKYEQVQEWVREEIESGRLKPGDLLPSEAELCGLLSVGRNSVRTALHNLSHDGVVETVKGVGTFCRQRERSSSMTIGYICLQSEDYIFPQIVQGSNQIFARNNYHLVLSESNANAATERDMLRRLSDRGVDGIIAFPAFDGEDRGNLDLFLEIEHSGIPVVLIDNYFPGEAFSAVVMNDVAGGRLAASYLWDRGHRKIGIVHQKTYYPKILRKEGAVAFLQEQGWPVPDEWIIGLKTVWDTATLQEKLSMIFADERRKRGDCPTAFFCSNDQEAIELIRAAQVKGLRVPEDISIISFDNSSLANLPNLTLTSINHPSRYMGEMAANILLEKIRYREVRANTSTIIEPAIVERDSVLDISTESGSQRPDIEPVD